MPKSKRQHPKQAKLEFYFEKDDSHEGASSEASSPPTSGSVQSAPQSAAPNSPGSQLGKQGKRDEYTRSQTRQGDAAQTSKKRDHPQESLQVLTSKSDQGPPSPSVRSPAKQRPQPQESRPQSPASPASYSELENFQTSDHPASGNLLKQMLLAFNNSLRAEFSTLITPLQASIQDLDSRVSHIETKMGAFANSHNQLVDSHNAVTDDLENIKAKLADLEDRSRRNNIKLRGIPEEVSSADLKQHIQGLIKILIPQCSAQDIIIDRAPRVPRPRHLPETFPRDVLARLHFFHVKEQVMATTRKKADLPPPYQMVKLYADLSATTLRLRRQLAPITSFLRE